MFCCSEALFVCGGGSAYYCEHCHDVGRKFEDCKGKNCPLGILHPPPSANVKLSAMPLGCSACRADRINQFSVAEVDDTEERKWTGWQEYIRDRQSHDPEFRQMRLNAIAEKALRALNAE